MMTRKLNTLFFLLLFSGITLQAFAYNPKVKKDGINEGIGTGGVEDGNEVKLPIGLPFSINDAPGASGPTDENGGYDQPSKIVYTFDLPDGQGPQSYHETHSAFEQARSMNAACVLIRMNSMSNALDAAENLSNEITDYDRPVMVYVNDKAIPASTLISMAADNKKNASNAKKNKHTFAAKNNKLTSDNQVKRAPRDERDCTTMSNVLPIGKQFSTEQNGDLDEVLTQAGLNNYTVVHYSHGFFAQMIDWCMKPFVSLLLVVLIALGLRLQIKSVFPGPATFLLLVALPFFGVPLFVGGLAGAGEFGLALFFAIGIVIVTRKKTVSPLLRSAAIFFFILALTLCQSVSFGPLSDWKIPALTFLLSSATFIAGWYLPVIVGKFRRTTTAELSPAV
jgi:membrane-bound ClpP family serine protease